jgi:hypothetical protein
MTTPGLEYQAGSWWVDQPWGSAGSTFDSMIDGLRGDRPNTGRARFELEDGCLSCQLSELRVQEQSHHIEHRTHGAWHVEQCAYRPLLGSEAFPDPTGTITGFLHLPQAV